MSKSRRLIAEVVLVDRKNRQVGLKEKYAAHQSPVPLHRAISVLIFNGDKVLLQKRAKQKPTWPGFWSNTCCTHPLPGESYKAAAERRLKEEMGFSVPLKEKFRFIYEAKYDETWGENEYDVVFKGEYAGPVSPNSDEIADYKWVDIEKLKEDINKNPKKYTPWFKIILERI